MSAIPERLHPDDVELIARRTAELAAALVLEALTVRPDPPVSSLLTAPQIAEMLGVSVDFVREHAVELGGFRIADQPRAPWRFDGNAARERLAARAASDTSSVPVSPSQHGRSRPARRRSKSTTGRILAIRGEAA